MREGVASQIGGAKLDAILNMAGNASVTHEDICNSKDIEQLSNSRVERTIPIFLRHSYAVTQANMS